MSGLRLEGTKGSLCVDINTVPVLDAEVDVVSSLAPWCSISFTLTEEFPISGKFLECLRFSWRLDAVAVRGSKKSHDKAAVRKTAPAPAPVAASVIWGGARLTTFKNCPSCAGSG